MCILAYVTGTPKGPFDVLLLVSNRDEEYERPTEVLARWQGNTDIIAGRDSRKGGTWLGINRHGVLAALTNQAGEIKEQDYSSRGHLVRQCLELESPLTEIPASITADQRCYRGFALLVGELLPARSKVPSIILGYHASENQDKPLSESLEWLSQEEWSRPGYIHVLTNKDPSAQPEWPKVHKIRNRMQTALSEIQHDEGPFWRKHFLDGVLRHDAQDTESCTTSQVFLQPRTRSGVVYGTVSSTIIMVQRSSCSGHSAKVTFIAYDWNKYYQGSLSESQIDQIETVYSFYL
jgi:uncharacterized protein with NRDE domain